MTICSRILVDPSLPDASVLLYLQGQYTTPLAVVSAYAMDALVAQYLEQKRLLAVQVAAIDPDKLVEQS